MGQGYRRSWPSDARRAEPTWHYFSHGRASRRRRTRSSLVLPDVSLRLVADRGVFAGRRVDPGTKLLLLEAPGPADRAAHLLDLGCGYGPIALALAARAPAATVWAVDVNERARALCRGQRRRQRRWPTCGSPHPTTCPTTSPSPASGRTRRSASARPTSTTCSNLAGPAGRRRSGLARRAQAAGRRLARPLAGRRGPRCRAARVEGRLPHPARSGGHEVAGQHRPQATPPRVAAPHRRPPRPAARRRAAAVQRRRHPPPGRGRTGSSTCGWSGRRRRPRPRRSARRRSGASATSPGRPPTGPKLRSSSWAARVGGWSASSWPTTARPHPRDDSRRPGVPGPRPRGPRAVPRRARRLRRGGVHPAAGPDRIAQRGRRRRRSPSTKPGARSGSAA